MGVRSRWTFAPLDLAAIRQAHPLPAVAGGVVKLHRAGNEWKACCPFHQDRSPSFTIYSGGERFQCFGCGASGDVLDFIQRLHGVGLRDAAEMLGGGELPSVVLPAIPANDQGDRADEALSIWRAAVPVTGTLAETYLRWRGITVEPPISLRYAELPYGRRGPALPCLVCCVSSPKGPVQGIQRIYLAAHGRGKLDVAKPKLSLGKVSGGAIRLAPLDDSELVVCEGPETGLSLLQVLARPVWVAAGASMLPAMRFPPSVRRVAVGGDNDEAGRAAAYKSAEAFALRGIEARVFFPVAGNDFNDAIQERASA
jgi:DNA primase